MNKLLIGAAAAIVAVGTLAFAATASGQEDARVRVIHASPDAPAVDVYVDGNAALEGVAFPAISDYLPVPAGEHQVQVFAAGADPASDTPVIDETLTLSGGTDYTVAAVGELANIQAAVIEDDNSQTAPGKAHVKVIHASPDAPAVDIAVAGGPVLVPNLAFPEAAGPLPVDAGTYDLEVRAAGTETVALPLDGVTLEEGTVYTVVAVGLLNGDPALTAEVAAVDVGTTGAAAPSPQASPQPPTTGADDLPDTGTGVGSDSGSSTVWLLVAGIAGAASIGTLGAGLALRRNR
jgi:hypothetical protein